MFSSRGVLPTVVRRCVWSRNLVNEEALAHSGVVAPETKKTSEVIGDWNRLQESDHTRN